MPGVSSIPTTALLTIAGAAALPGCHRASPAADPMAQFGYMQPTYPTREESFSTAQIPNRSEPQTPVKTGRTPLVYITVAAGTLRISDVTTGQELMSPLEVPARTVISVNSETGVSVGGAPVRRGPLNEDHEFGIYLLAPGDNTFRTGTISEGRSTAPQVPQPTSNPSRPEVSR